MDAAKIDGDASIGLRPFELGSLPPSAAVLVVGGAGKSALARRLAAHLADGDAKALEVPSGGDAPAEVERYLQLRRRDWGSARGRGAGLLSARQAPACRPRSAPTWTLCSCSGAWTAAPSRARTSSTARSSRPSGSSRPRTAGAPCSPTAPWSYTAAPAHPRWRTSISRGGQLEAPCSTCRAHRSKPSFLE